MSRLDRQVRCISCLKTDALKVLILIQPANSPGTTKKPRQIPTDWDKQKAIMCICGCAEECVWKAKTARQSSSKQRK